MMMTLTQCRRLTDDVTAATSVAITTPDDGGWPVDAAGCGCGQQSLSRKSVMDR